MRTYLTLAMILALAACSRSPSESSNAPSGNEKTPSPTANTAPTSPAPTVVPAQYRGVWDNVKGDCAPDSDMRVEIGDRQIDFYESHGRIKQLSLENPDRLRMTLAMEGEGEQWSQAMRFTLSPNMKTMTVQPVGGDESGHISTLKRCPS